MDARSRLTSAPATRGRARSRGVPTRRAGRPSSEYTVRWSRPVPTNHSGFRSSGPSRSAAPRSVTKLRSPPGATITPIRPVLAPVTRTARIVTPSDSSALTSALPALSRPIAAMKLLWAPTRASQRAVVAADPPCTIMTRPVTSVPSAIASLGATTTSRTRSPRTTTRGPGVADGPRRAVGMAGRVGAGGRVGAVGWRACPRAYRPRRPAR